MKYETLFIQFKDIPDEEVQEITNKFYADNRNKISGMTANILRDKSAYDLAKKTFKEAMKE